MQQKKNKIKIDIDKKDKKHHWNNNSNDVKSIMNKNHQRISNIVWIISDGFFFRCFLFCLFSDACCYFKFKKKNSFYLIGHSLFWYDYGIGRHPKDQILWFDDLLVACYIMFCGTLQWWLFFFSLLISSLFILFFLCVQSTVVFFSFFYFDFISIILKW